MIETMYYVCDSELELHYTTKDRREAGHQAIELAQTHEEPFAVMLRVPIAEFPELRAVAVYSWDGRCVWETDVYEPELV